MSYGGADSSYVFSGGYGFGASATIFFDQGGYYSRKIYGIRLEGIYARHNQSYRIFPGEGKIDPDVFYSYRLKMSYIDVPLLFTLCPTHHQGLTLEAGPQISFFQGAQSQIKEEKNTFGSLPAASNAFFKPLAFSVIGGAGIYYSFSESFALTGTVRATYGLSNLLNSGVIQTSVSPRNRLILGVYVQAVYKINKYDAKKNKGYKYYLKRIRK
jgi:hypothetical protein